MTWADLAFLAGRALFGGYFVYAGLNHVRNLRAMSGYAAMKKVPQPTVAVLGTGLLLLGGGLSILLGLYPWIGAAMLSVFFVGVTPKMHDFWTVQDRMQRMGEQVNFLKNVALFGATLMLTALPQPWPYSLGAPF